MIKRIAVLTRRPELSREEFAKHWREVHGELSKRVPNMLRYVQNLVTEEVPHPHLPGGVSNIDGFAEIWFKDRETMEAALTTEEFKELYADGPLFTATSVTFHVHEDVVIDG